MLQDELKAQEEAAINKANETYLEFENRRIDKLHGENGFYKMAGKDAYNAMGKTLEELEEEKKAITEGLSQRELEYFEKQYQRSMLSTKQGVYKHGNDGLKAWSIQTEDGNFENAFENGALNYRNDEQIGLHWATAREAVINKAKLTGVSGKQLTEQLETAKSKYFATVIGRAIQQEPARGEELIEKYGKDMEVADLDQVKSELEGYKRDEEVMQTVDSWMAAGLGITDARERAQAIDDPKTRKQAMDDFKVRYKEREHEINESKDEMFNSYSSAIDNGEIKYSQIPRKDRDFLTHGQRNSLRALEKQKYGDGKVEEMPFKLRMKMDELIQSGKQAQARRLLSENAHLMTKQDRKEYSKAVSKGIEDPEVYRLQTFHAMTKDYSKDLNDEERNQFFSVAEKWRQNYIKTHGKEPTPEEEREHLTWLLVNEDGWDYGERWEEPTLINQRVLEEHVEQLNQERANRGLPPATAKEINVLDQRLRQNGYYIENR